MTWFGLGCTEGVLKAALELLAKYSSKHHPHTVPNLSPDFVETISNLQRISPDNFSWKCRRLVPSEPRVFLRLISISRLAHIKSTDDWNARLGVRANSERRLKSPPILILSWKWPSFLCCNASSHMERENESYFRGRCGKRTPLVIFLFAPYSLLSAPAHRSDCLRKTASSLSCFFIDRT